MAMVLVQHHHQNGSNGTASKSKPHRSKKVNINENQLNGMTLTECINSELYAFKEMPSTIAARKKAQKALSKKKDDSLDIDDNHNHKFGLYPCTYLNQSRYKIYAIHKVSEQRMIIDQNVDIVIKDL